MLHINSKLKCEHKLSSPKYMTQGNAMIDIIVFIPQLINLQEHPLCMRTWYEGFYAGKSVITFIA